MTKFLGDSMKDRPTEIVKTATASRSNSFQSDLATACASRRVPASARATVPAHENAGVVTRPLVTISISRSVVGIESPTPNRTGRTTVTGAVLAGLALSQTLVHTRPLNASHHAKLRV